MRLNAPTFWHKRFSLPGLLLSPFSLLYGAAHTLRQSAVSAYDSPVPVICIGNLVAGGSGKTPAAMAIMDAIRNAMLAKKPCFMSRGYGGSAKGPVLVDPDRHTAKDVGDEPLVLAHKAPVVVGGDREKSAKLAESKGFDVIVMDDGLQNPGLHKDVKFVVIDGKRGFGNGLMLPAGPLREPVRAGLKRADAIILIGNDERGITKRIPAETPVFRAQLKVSESWIADGKTRYLAFSGIAYPEKFYQTLKATDIHVIDWRPFPDHYVFSQEELDSLADEAEREHARLLTTAKDAARLPHSFTRKHVVDILPIEIVWDQPEQITDFLKQKLKKRVQFHETAKI